MQSLKKIVARQREELRIAHDIPTYKLLKELWDAIDKKNIMDRIANDTVNEMLTDDIEREMRK